MSVLSERAGYEGPYHFHRTPYWYIHLSKKHIGMANKGIPLSDGDLARMYQSYKNDVIVAGQKTFQTFNKMNFDSEDIDFLNEIFNNNDLYSMVDNQIQEKLQKELNVEGMRQIHNLSQTTAIEKIGQNMAKARTSAQSFNRLLELLAEGCKVMNNQYSLALAVALADSKSPDGLFEMRPGQMGEVLTAAIASVENNQNLNGTLFERQQFEVLLNNLKPLAKNLMREKTGTGKDAKDITGGAIQKMIDNIFSTGFGEGISAMADFIAISETDNSLSQVSFSGDKGSMPVFTDEKGNIVEFNEVKSREAAGKSDIRFNNFKITVEINGQKREISIDLGISDKMYRTAAFYPDDTGTEAVGSFSAGSGGTIAEAILATVGAQDRAQYLAYNVLASDVGAKNMSQSVEALQDLITRRQITRLFATRNGAADFSQYMYVNGRVISIWQIVQAVSNPNKSFGKTASTGGKDQSVILSLGEARKGMIAAGRKRDQMARAEGVYQAAHNGAIKAHLNLKQLLGVI